MKAVKRIAFFGPLNPDNTGIADYDETLLPLLRKHYEIDVFLPYRSVRADVYPHWEFYFRHKQRPYDLMLYQLGNNAKFHGYIFGYAFQFPGATVFHDYCIHHARAGALLDRGLYQDYRRELEAVYPEFADQIGNAAITFAAGGLLYFLFPFYHLVLRASLAAAAHTKSTAGELRKENTPVIHIPHLQLPATAPAGEDPFPGRFVIGAFGFATRAKRISPVLQTIARLRYYYPHVLYLIGGEIEKPAELRAEIATLGIDPFVKITGFLEEPEFLRMILRSDVVLNLRYPSAGEMSGTLIRAMSCAKPVLMTRLGLPHDVPTETAVWIRPDHESEDLFHTLTKLIENPYYRQRLGTAARNYIEECHRPEDAVTRYCELIETAIERKQLFRKPELPAHLQSAKEILRRHLLKTSLNGKDSPLLDWIL